MMEDASTADEYEYQYTERLRRLLEIESNLSHGFRYALNNIAKLIFEDREYELMHGVKSFFYNDLDADKHREEDVRTLVRCIPSVLEHDESYDFPGSLPYFLTRRVESAPFVPVVAEEAIRMNFYDDPSLRGGLLYEDPHRGNTAIELLCAYHDSEHDPVYLATIRRLKEMDLIKMEDIRERNLLFCCGQVFVDFFTDWDPGALKTKYDDLGDSYYLHHYMITILAKFALDKEYYIWYKFYSLCTKQIIKASFRHYPDELGLLLLENDEGSTLWKELTDLIGSQEAWEIITDSIDDTSNDKVFEESSGEEDQKVSFAPLFTAAVTEHLSVDLSILYHLLRKEPAEWIAYLDEEPAMYKEEAKR